MNFTYQVIIHETMLSEEVRDLTTVMKKSNVAGAFKYAMTKALKSPINGEFAVDSKGYILKFDGKVLKFIVSHAFPAGSDMSQEDKTYQVLEELRHTSIGGKYYDLFDIKNINSSDYLVKVMKKTVNDFVKIYKPKDEFFVRFWAKLGKLYDRDLLYRKPNPNGTNVLAYSKDLISIIIDFDYLKYKRVDKFVKNKIEGILTNEIKAASNDCFIYNKLVFVFAPTADMGMYLSIYIQ